MITLIVISLLGFLLYVLAATINSKEDSTSNTFLVLGLILAAIIITTVHQIATSEMVVSRIVNAYHNGELIETIHIEGTDTTRTYKYKEQ